MVFLAVTFAISIDNRGGGWDGRRGGVRRGGMSGVRGGKNHCLGHPMSAMMPTQWPITQWWAP